MTPTDQTTHWKGRFRHYYHQHELKLEVAMFCAGFVFDKIATSEGVADVKMIVQQVFYLVVIGFILYMDILREARGGEAQFSPRIEKMWDYRGLALHFFLGTLMNIYTIFFLLSASFFNSIFFVVLLFMALVANELKAVRKRGADIKVALYVICFFCFASLMFPLLFNHVGRLPFLCAFATTVALVGAFYHRLRKRVGPEGLKQKLLYPGLGVSFLFLALYFVGLTPPVPVSAAKIGLYHHIEKDRDTDEYVLQSERPWWKFWQRGDQDFVARPGDRIWFFAAISSPARFDDMVYVRWMFHTAKGWQLSDRKAVRFSGGRKGGFRVPTYKDNYDYGDGEWKVQVETQDEREIGRLYFTVTKADVDPGRVFQEERY